MLEKPGIPDETVIDCLQGEFGLETTSLEFLPLGADQNTAVYRATTREGSKYFVKLRSGIFDEMTAAIPRLVSESGIDNVIPLITTINGQLRADLGGYKLLLYAFIEGRDGNKVKLSARQWKVFGEAIYRLHNLELPPEYIRQINRETYSPEWREKLTDQLHRVYEDKFEHPLARKLVKFLNKRVAINAEMIRRAEYLARLLREAPPDTVLCHSDLHAGNILVDKGGRLYIVDWDNPILAPRERDLMFIADAHGFQGYSPEEEESLFYLGYGQTRIDQRALAYFRYARIIEDLAIFCDQILNPKDSLEELEQALMYLESNYLPGNTIDLAFRADQNKYDG